MMAVLLAPHFADVDFARLAKICIVHDPGEIVGDDIPAPDQARRRAADSSATKSGDKRRDLPTLVAPLPPETALEIVALWDEYEAAVTPEARLTKALDKLETILEHTQAENPVGCAYRYNLGYGRECIAGYPVTVALRTALHAETERRTHNE